MHYKLKKKMNHPQKSTEVICKLNKNNFLRFFKNGVGGSWELNIFIGKYNIRIARHQFAFWKNLNSIFNFNIK